VVDVEKVLALYRERYFDLNVKHFVEKLHEQHHIELSYTWVKNALQTAGLVERQRKRGPHRKKRERRPLAGMLLHVDGSRHRWIPGLDGYQDMIVVFDDATSEMYYARLVEEESTETVMTALKQVIADRGVFCSLYSDRGSHFVFTPRAGGPPDHRVKTQIVRALEQMGSEPHDCFPAFEVYIGKQLIHNYTPSSYDPDTSIAYCLAGFGQINSGPNRGNIY
jgi:hypothetical protein